MSQVYSKTIDHPSAWTPAGLGGKEGLCRPLSTSELHAVAEFLQRTRHLPTQGAVKEYFSTPVLRALVEELRELIMEGRGLAVVSGLPPDRYSVDDYERVLHAIGLHLGIASQENHAGSRIAYVQNETENPNSRGYRSSAELRLHSDSFELLGLLCARRAESGGVTTLASALTIHNVIFTERPERLEPLYRGYPEFINELRHTSRPVTDIPVPIFCCVDGKVSCLARGSKMRAAARHFGTTLPDDLTEALAFFNEVANRPDVSLSFMLEPGELLLANNFTNLHARTDFQDSAEHKRLLLRLHCDVPNGRPVVEGMHANSRSLAWFWQEGWKEAAAAKKKAGAEGAAA